MSDTGRHLIGYDHSSGKIVRRRIYADASGNEYVRMGRYSSQDPEACVEKQWFCDHVIKEGTIERRYGKSLRTNDVEI